MRPYTTATTGAVAPRLGSGEARQAYRTRAAGQEASSCPTMRITVALRETIRVMSDAAAQRELPQEDRGAFG